MSDPRWVEDLFTLSLTELQQKYLKPKDQRSLTELRRYYINKVTRMEQSGNPDQNRELVRILQDAGVNIDNVEEAQVGFHVGYIKNSEGEIEYTKPLPSFRVTRRTNDRLEDFAPATPARITPSRRKAAERDHEVFYVFSDPQIDYRRLDDGSLEPIHDERAMRVGRMLCRDLQPDYIINLGDTVDLSVLSRFKSDSDHFQRTLGPSFQRAHDMYAELRADNPHARIIEVDSNHNTRLKDFVLKNAPALYNLTPPGSEPDAYPSLSYPALANLNPLGVEWISGYGSAEFIYDDNLLFRHGTTSAGRGSTAARVSDPELNVVQGHAHRMESFTRTTRAGRYLSSIVVGTLCRTTGEVPSFYSAVNDRNQVVKHQENWQQGVLAIYAYGDGHYQFDHIAIRNGQSYYQGKEYNGNES